MKVRSKKLTKIENCINKLDYKDIPIEVIQMLNEEFESWSYLKSVLELKKSTQKQTI
jgi:hypothetical protein|tara:strand:- start:814 stop:984 length:171 start_codon:yes stop_codon:yes gene_type:complete